MSTPAMDLCVSSLISAHGWQSEPQTPAGPTCLPPAPRPNYWAC